MPIQWSLFTQLFTTRKVNTSDTFIWIYLFIQSVSTIAYAKINASIVLTKCSHWLPVFSGMHLSIVTLCTVEKCKWTRKSNQCMFLSWNVWINFHELSPFLDLQISVTLSLPRRFPCYSTTQATANSVTWLLVINRMQNINNIVNIQDENRITIIIIIIIIMALPGYISTGDMA